MLRRIVSGLACSVLLASPASAGTIVVKLGLAPGQLQIRAANVTTTAATITVADGRGSGAGWTVRSSVAVTVVGITARCAAHSTCVLPSAASAPAGGVVLEAADGTGMGVMTLSVTYRATPKTPTFTVS